jgi:hypothetical protein
LIGSVLYYYNRISHHKFKVFWSKVLCVTNSSQNSHQTVDQQIILKVDRVIQNETYYMRVEGSNYRFVTNVLSLLNESGYMDK